MTPILTRVYVYWVRLLVLKETFTPFDSFYGNDEKRNPFTLKFKIHLTTKHFFISYVWYRYTMRLSNSIWESRMYFTENSQRNSITQQQLMTVRTEHTLERNLQTVTTNRPSLQTTHPNLTLRNAIFFLVLYSQFLSIALFVLFLQLDFYSWNQYGVSSKFCLWLILWVIGVGTDSKGGSSDWCWRPDGTATDYFCQ